MTPTDRWRRVRELFELALEQDSRDLRPWLDRETAGNAQIRDEVLSLLDHHSRAGSFLATPAGRQLDDLLADDRRFEPGEAIGPYSIEREVGRGGMGRVYLARDSRLGRLVALKALSPEFTADASRRNRLRREARAAAALAHPGICTVYALEDIDGELFIASEYVDGHTLRAEIDSGVRPTSDAVTVAAQELAAALAHAHARGITHRDLKPENIMRASDGRLKILDFGLARIGLPETEGERHVTQPGALLGTPAYMAPEQLNGSATDARVDVFAYGVVLYEFACGTHPFAAATSLATAARILESDAADIRERCPGLPPAIVSVLDRCLRKSPAERFAAGPEIVTALTGAPPAIRPAGMARWWRTHQLVVLGLYFVACGAAWQAKEWMPGVATSVFVGACIAATIAGVFRGHLIFTERLNPSGFPNERRRALPITLSVDLFLGLALAFDGLLLAGDRPLAAVLTAALGIGIALVRLVVEPATTSASFR